MADNQREEEAGLPQNAPAQHNRREPGDRLAALSGILLERADTLIYSAVGVLFLAGALVALVYSIWDFVGGVQGLVVQIAAGKPVGQGVAESIVKFVSDLLLVLIIMEVLSTIIQYLKAHATSLRPFLFIGIISATRSILSIGARLSIGELQDGAFTDAMIELGVSAAVVLALGITLKLLGRTVDTDLPGE